MAQSLSQKRGLKKFRQEVSTIQAEQGVDYRTACRIRRQSRGMAVKEASRRQAQAVKPAQLPSVVADVCEEDELVQLALRARALLQVAGSTSRAKEAIDMVNRLSSTSS